MCALISSTLLSHEKAKTYTIVAFDLDGTLTPSKSPLEPETAELLPALLEKKKVAVISGAAFTQFQEQFLRYIHCSPALLRNLFILSTNGSGVCQLDPVAKDWKCENDRPFTISEKEKIKEAFEKAFVVSGFTVPEKTYGQLIEDRGNQMTFSALGQKAPLAVKRAWDPDHAKRQEIVQALRPLLPDFSIHIGGATSIDVTRAGIDKAYGLKRLLTLLDISPSHMLYVGDELFPDGNDSPAMTVGVDCISVTGPEETQKIIALCS